MKAVTLAEFGNPDVLRITDVAEPVTGDDDLLVRVHATALNRADLLQRRGLYPPPKGASEVLGLEAAGEVVSVGSSCSHKFTIGDRICALLPGGGYAEYVAVPSDLAMKLPDSLSFTGAAAIPEVFLTAWLNLFWLAAVEASHQVLIHAGASGVGTAAIQLVREIGGVSYVTASSSKKLDFCTQLGARAGWNYKEGPFAQWVLRETSGTGVNAILDFIGASYLEQNLQCLGTDGRLIIIGTMGGSIAERVNLGQLLYKRQHIIGTALRSRSLQDKIRLTHDFWNFALPHFESGALRPIVDTVFDWTDAAKAHAYMESNQNIGKIVLRVT